MVRVHRALGLQIACCGAPVVERYAAIVSPAHGAQVATPGRIAHPANLERSPLGAPLQRRATPARIVYGSRRPLPMCNPRNYPRNRNIGERGERAAGPRASYEVTRTARKEYAEWRGDRDACRERAEDASAQGGGGCS